MALAAGTKLGSYEITGAIGAGGMGEVYQAHDTKLGRDVAIKVLPEAFAHDAERLSRFQREAKMLASLNHPNIATIHGLEQSGGTSYLVMELVSGETLAERVKAGPIGIEEALKIAVQIAEALEAAHEKNIIHRDLKPANVKVTPEGKVKVLDFGLAKAFAGDATTEDIGNSPTLSIAATMQGVILGTAAYMSPEQAKGKAVDKRTDIWAFGCVLYELLTGKQAFHGEDITDILAAVVRAEPDWSLLPASTPSKIRDVLQRCLQKDKALRLRDAGDACIEIREALTAPASAASVNVTANRLAGWRLPVLMGAAALVVAAAAGFVGWNLKPTPSKPVTRTVITLPPGDQLAAFDYPAIAISPDGTLLAYAAIHAGTRQLYLRALDSLEAKPLADTEGANTPFFSPDGRWLGFVAGGYLKKISVNGGAAQTLGNAPVPSGATWGSDGTIIFVPSTASIIEQISDAGGPPQVLSHFAKGEGGQLWPQLLPGGKAFLFVSAGGIGNSRIVARSLSSGERHELVAGGTQPQYAMPGYLFYAQGGNLMAAPFDPQRLQITGVAVPIADGVRRIGFTGGAQYALSGTGSLVYVPGGNVAAERMVWVSRNGTEKALAAPPHEYVTPRISPDGRRVAVTVAEQENQVWLYDFGRDTLSRLTFGGNVTQTPAWTPDGKRIAFTSNKEGPLNIFWQPADGSGEMERLTTSEYTDVPRSFSPDGQLLAFLELGSATGYDVSVLRLRDRKTQPFIRTPTNESVPSFSPDGHWLAYISDESGRFEVYAQPYPGPGGKYQISTDGGTEPVWNPNGKELFYRSGDKMMAVDVTTQPAFSVGKPKMLFQGPYVPTPFTFPNYDVSPDGRRFLMIKESEQASSLNQINVVLNWFEELKRRVPTGNK
jgi:Tol biopolymer transport system component